MADVDVTLGLDVNGALKNIKHMSEALESIKFAEFAELGIKAGEFITEAFHKVVEVLGESIDAASKADEAYTNLSVAMKLSGNYTDDARENFAHLSEELEKTTKFSHAAADSALAIAETYGISNAAAEKLVKAAADLATVQGTDLVTATEKLGRTYTGAARELGRTIPGVKALTAAQLEQGAAIDLIAAKFHGAAAAATETYAGAMQQTKNRMEEVLETIGKFITHNTVVVALIKAVGAAFETMSRYLVDNKKAISEFITIALVGLVNAIPTIIDGVQFLGNILGGVVKLVTLAAAGALDFFGAFVRIPVINELITFLLKGLGAIVYAFVALTDAIKDIPGVGSVLGSIGVDTKKLGDTLDSVNQKVFEFTANVSSEDLAGSLDKMRDKTFDAFNATDQIMQSTNEKFGLLKSGAVSLAESITKIGQAQGDALENANAKLENQAKILLRLSAAQQAQLTQAGVKNPLAGFIQSPQFLERNGIKVQIDPATGRPIQGSGGALGTGAALGGIQSLLQGDKGATSLITGAGGAVADSFLPGSGAAVSAILGQLAQGPDAAKGFVDSFVKSVPIIITNIVKSIPVVIKALIDDLPDFIQALADAAPDIIEALVLSMPDIIAKTFEKLPDIMYKSFVSSFITVPLKLAEGAVKFIEKIIIGAGQFVGKILDGGGQFLGKLLDGAVQFIAKIVEGAGQFVQELFNKLTGIGGGSGQGGIVGGALGGIKGAFNPLVGGSVGAIGGAIGGLLGGGGFGFKGTTGSQSAATSSSSDLHEKIDRLVTALEGGSQPVAISLKIGNRDIAQSLIDINRMGLRTT